MATYGCDFGDLFLTKHSAPVAEVGLSGRLRLLCEVPGPGKAARGPGGGSVAVAPPGFTGPEISVKPSKSGNGCDFRDLFRTKHSAPGAEVGVSGRLRLLCEVPGPGKAAKAKGQKVVVFVRSQQTN